jgi:hypothetical protein
VNLTVYTQTRYDEQMEDLLEQAYERFVIKKEGTAQQRKRIKKSYDADSQLLEVWSFFVFVDVVTRVRICSIYER